MRKEKVKKVNMKEIDYPILQGFIEAIKAAEVSKPVAFRIYKALASQFRGRMTKAAESCLKRTIKEMKSALSEFRMPPDNWDGG